MSSAVFAESGFRFDFSDSIDAFVADKPAYYGLSAVDFIIETENEHLFIEVKNPDNKKAHPLGRKTFLENLGLDDYPVKISLKFKDSLLKELAAGREFSKPIVFVLLLEYRDFDASQKRILYERINCRIPKFSEKEVFKKANCIRFLLHNRSEFALAFSNFEITEL